VQLLLVLDPEQRFGSTQQGGAVAVKGHRFFADVEWDNLGNRASPLL